MMNFTLSALTQSLADYLAPVLPGVAFVAGPDQTDQRPCLYMQPSVRTHKRCGGFLCTAELALCYLPDAQSADPQAACTRTAETLDAVMETFPYTDGASAETTLLRTHDREWDIEQNTLRYRFELRVRVTLPETDVPMETMDYNPEVISPNG